jgi:alpha-tubulin suppressor-like RCC1 family protein
MAAVSVGAISAGHGHTCAVVTGGGLLCWGSNMGQLGIGSFVHQFEDSPAAVDLGSGIDL